MWYKLGCVEYIIPNILKVFIVSYFLIATEAVYRLEVGVTYGGGNIGNCGSYKTPAEIETACNNDQTCIGYSTHRDLNTGAEPFAENGFYPWCLKKTEGQTRIVKNQNYYRKNPTNGNKITL